MKLFQRLLVAPAALGLMAPIAVTAAELNINDVSNYDSRTSSSSRVQGSSQFSDIYSSDWAFQALNNMFENHSCAPITATSLTRFEAAALLNKCLRNISQANEEERLLINEFSSELALIKGSLDGVEAGIGVEESVFSSTTKLSGESIWVVGGIDQNGSTTESTTFNYHHILELESSFTGEDLLLTAIEAGNFSASDPFGGDGVAALESNYSSSDALEMAKMFYQFPWNDDFTITIGPKVRQDDMLGVWPSDYPSDTVLDVLTYAGAPGAYNLAEGAGAGITYARDNFSTSFVLVSEDGSNASSAESTAGGIMTAQGKDSVTAQVAWVEDNYTIAAAYTKSDGGNWNDSVNASDFSAYTIGGVYQPDVDTRLIPSSISAGIGWKNPDNEDSPDTASNSVEDDTTWTIGLLWDNVGTEGNTLGIGYGTAEDHRDDPGYDDPMAWELFYSMAVSDNITVTPAIFSVEKDSAEDVTGALVKTTFSF